MTEEKKRDCVLFRAAVDEFNASQGRKVITDGYLFRLSGETITRQTWWANLNAVKGMTVWAKMYGAIALRRRPQDVWPDWSWSLLTRVAPDERISMADKLLSDLRERERTALLNAMALFATNRTKRREIMRLVREAESEDALPARKEAG